MDVLFEASRRVGGVSGKVYAVQGPVRLHPEPVLVGDNAGDGAGVSVYGSVLHDGGRYRMWYQAWPRDWNGDNSALVGYAESDDGIGWRKPRLELEPRVPGPHNLTNLGFHAPAVFVDPEAPASHRYRATGWTATGCCGAPAKLGPGGYYTAHSADGLDWQLDQLTPTWHGSDVISSVWHPQQRRALVAIKHLARVNGVPRRAIWQAEMRAGQCSPEVSALIPDEFDDVSAIARGFVSGDYYGMGFLPAGEGTLGFLWQFRHKLPRTASIGYEVGVFGATDVSLVWQAGPGERWLHFPGRQDLLTHGSLPWNTGGIYTAASAITVNDEQRLYFCGAAVSHAWYVNANWQVIPHRKAQMIREGFGRIGFASWPKWRLCGFTADPEGTLDLALGPLSGPCRLVLNYETIRDGSVRAEVPGVAGYELTAAVPLTGQSTGQAVAWQGGPVLDPARVGQHPTVRLHLDCATVWAYELV